MSIALRELSAGRRFTIYAVEEVAETAGPGRAEAPARSCPVLEFLQQCDVKERARMVRRLDYTADNGPSWNEQQCRKLTDEIWEFKTSAGLRLLWFYDRGQMIICTSGYMKQRQKADRDQIARAELWRQKYVTARAAGKVEIVAGKTI